MTKFEENECFIKMYPIQNFYPPSFSSDFLQASPLFCGLLLRSLEAFKQPFGVHRVSVVAISLLRLWQSRSTIFPIRIELSLAFAELVDAPLLFVVSFLFRFLSPFFVPTHARKQTRKIHPFVSGRRFRLSGRRRLGFARLDLLNPFAVFARSGTLTERMEEGNENTAEASNQRSIHRARLGSFLFLLSLFFLLLFLLFPTFLHGFFIATYFRLDRR